MKPLRKLARTLGTATLAFGIAPVQAEFRLPSIPDQGSSLKAVEIADKAAAAQAAAEKAAATQAAAEKAAATQAAAEKAAAIQAAAEKAAAAQKAAEAAAKAEQLQLRVQAAAEAQKAAEKAAAAEKTAAKSSALQKAAESAAAAEKAQAAQKRAEQADRAQKALQSSRVGKDAPAAESAAKSVERALKANSATPARGIEKGSTGPVKVPASAAGELAIRALEPKDVDTGKAARVETSPSKEGSRQENPADDPASRVKEARQLQSDTTRELLDGIGLAPDVSAKLAKDAVDPDKAESAKEKIGAVAGAAADLQLVAVPEEQSRKIIDAVVRSADPKATANEKVGEAATETVFGKDVAQRVPADKRGDFRAVFKNLADIRGTLETLGGDPDDPEVKEAVNEAALRGVTTREEARGIVEVAGQKVLDRQGFSPAKEGEGLGDRLNRIAEEQKAAEAARKAAEAAKRAARAAAAGLKGARLGREVATQGASGSTIAGRSVSARVEVGIGGGTGKTSGAGTAATGTGVDSTKSTGTGGSFRDTMPSRQLAAGAGGAVNSNTNTAGSVSAGTVIGAAPAAGSGQSTVDPSAPEVSVPATGGSPAAVAPAPAAEAPASMPANASSGSQSGADSPVASVSTGDEGFTVGGGTGESFQDIYQEKDGGHNLTFNPDGTFSGTVTTVTRNDDGSVATSTTTVVAGTWGVNEDGEVVITSATTAAPGDNASNQQNASAPPSGDAGGNGDQNGGGGDDDDKDKGGGGGDDPPPADQDADSDSPDNTAPAETEGEGSTPNPLDERGGNPAELSIRTGGRLGGQEAKNQQRGLDLARSGGGAAGPSANESGSSGVLLTKEEQANASRLLGMKRGGGVTDPDPLDEGGAAVTERDLNELHLRGTGGAKGPTDRTGPAAPADPKSPVGGVAPVPVGGTRSPSSVAPAAVRGASQINVQIKEQVR